MMTFELATFSSQADFRSAEALHTLQCLQSSPTLGNILKAFVCSIFSS